MSELELKTIASKLLNRAGLFVALLGLCAMTASLSLSVAHAQRNVPPQYLASLLADRFGADPAKAEAAGKSLTGVRVTQENRAAVWSAYLKSPLHGALKASLDQKTVMTTDRTSPYLWRTVGLRPKAGWALVIAMHGGGGAPKEVNDGEWRYMFSTYYREHPEAGGYIYLALRAPNDAWNGFYDDSISPLVENLIKQFVLFQDVDPNRVYILGASHGGYGAFVIGPKIPYRFAAIHAAASAPTDDETMGENLRNVRFTYMVGERDTAYGRADRDQQFAKRLEEWRTRYGGYSSRFELMKSTGHLVPDHDKLAEMLTYTRDPWPKKIVWTQSDTVLHRFYWIEALDPVNGGHIEATVEGNTIRILAEKQKEIALWLDSKLLNVNWPIVVRVEGSAPKQMTFRLASTLEQVCRGIEQTSDPNLTAPVRLVVNLQ